MDSTIELHNINLKDAIFFTMQSLKGHNSRITRLVFDGTSSKLASGSTDTTVRIWEITEGLLQVFRV
jgi:WD40 repeat protein